MRKNHILCAFDFTNAFPIMLALKIESGSEIQTAFSLLALPYSPDALFVQMGEEKVFWKKKNLLK